MEHLSSSGLAATFIDLKLEEAWTGLSTEFIPTIREKCIGNGKLSWETKQVSGLRNGENCLCVILWDKPQIQGKNLILCSLGLFKKDGLREINESFKNVII